MSSLILTEYACEKPCKYCRVTGHCPRLPAETVITFTKPWHPNDGSEDASLRCGCTIPWPIVQAFGQHIHGQVWCSVHGWQPKLTQKDIADAKKVARRHSADTSGTFDDIPPY